MLRKSIGSFMAVILLCLLALPAAGAAEDPVSAIEDELADASKLSAHSAQWSFDNTNPSFFGGDTSRLVRMDVTTESIAYRLEGIRDFVVRLHVFAGSTGSIKFYGSGDGEAWTEISAVHDAPASSGDGAWSGTNYTPAAPLPDGIDYLKVELSGDLAGWLMQIGSVALTNAAPGGGGTGGAGDYYVDAAGGSDAGDGRTPGTAWKTFAKVNRTTFAPGDRILLKKGGVWNGQLSPKGSGTAESPIVLSAYGIGGKPVINGGGIAGAAVYLRNASNWIIQGLEVTNAAAERGDIYREGIMVENANGGTLSHIKILDNYVHDVSSSFRYPAGAGFDGGPHAFGGISVYTGGAEPADKFEDVLIQGNTVERIGRTGIVVWDQRWDGDGYATTGVQIRQNYVRQADSDGILTFGADGALIEHNVAEGGGNYSEVGQFNGSAAIWPTRGQNNVVQFNESFNTNKPEGDGQGFNLDIDTQDSIVQYNYSHDNKGGFILFVDARLTPGVLTGSSNNIVRYNVSQNDLTHTFNFAGGVSPGTQIYNNTVYIGTGQNTKIIDHEWNEAGDLNAAYSFKNNLIYNLGTGGYSLPGIGGVFDHNLFYGIHPTDEPEDANKLTANPLLAYQGGGGTGRDTVQGYQLREGSPALGAGTPIAGNGGFDYWGNPVSATEAPNIGAYSGPGLDPSTLPEQPVDDLRLYYHGLTVVPHVADDATGAKTLRLSFANGSETDSLAIGSISWKVGTGDEALSGTKTEVPPVAPAGTSIVEIPLPGLEEGVLYPLELTALLPGYEPVQLTRAIDFNRVLQQTDEREPITFDLADGTNLVNGYNGADDLGGTLKLRWDETNLYLSADIKDDVDTHEAAGANIWQNDGIQFSVAPGVPGDSANWYEYGISQTPEGPQVYRWLTMQGAATGAVTNGKLTVQRDEAAKTTSYRLALPWSELSPMLGAAHRTLSFSLLVNDNDGAGRKGYIEWGSGIGGAKDSALFRTIQLMSPLGETTSPPSGTATGSVVAQPNMVDQGTITAAGTGAQNGIVQAEIGVADLNKAIDGARDGRLTIRVVPGDTGGSGASVKVPADALAAAGDKVESITVEAFGASVTLPAKTLAGLLPKGAKVLDLVIVKADAASLPVKWQGYPVYDFDLKVDGTAVLALEGGEPVAVRLAYTPKPEEKAHQLVVYAIGEDGQTEIVKQTGYDAAGGQLEFKPKHFGRYGAAYADVRFADVATGSKTGTIVETLAAREIVQGTGDGKFEPNRKITRSEFVQLLIGALDLKADGSAAGSSAAGSGGGAFPDVLPGAWNNAAVSAARSLGIASGRGDGTFGGSDAITREEMAAMAYRAWRLTPAGSAGGKATNAVPAAAFKDQARIGSYALEAIDRLQTAGVLQGYADGTFSPRGLTTRAEAAAVVYRLLGL
ncbi:S-layer homology domain-containing protein [Cohnella sp. GCM10020058]|uniref:S-layer homology domain-containing protein n=1 Tax=Cohnella sp. GCM10020058 TaxID=3317330 RepID=UPI00362C7E22